MLGGSGGRGRCGIAMGPVTGMLALCALGCSALGLLLLPERGPSVQPCAMKGFNEGFNSSNPARSHCMSSTQSACTTSLLMLLIPDSLCSQETWNMQAMADEARMAGYAHSSRTGALEHCTAHAASACAGH